MSDQTTSSIGAVRLDLTENRDVHAFERVSIKVQNIQSDLVIIQGLREALVIEADPDLLSRVTTRVKDGELMIRINGSWSDFIKEALTTSFTRRCIKYTLTVRQLATLDLDGLIHLETANLETDHLGLRFRGPGSAQLTSLQANLLDVDISGPCKVEVSGKVVEQRVSVSPIGFYYAPKLESKKAVARLNGPGQATICVSDYLDASIAGPGRLEYYGAPRVKRNGNSLGLLVHLGNP